MGKEEELKNWKVAIVRVYRSEFLEAKTEEEAREIATQRCGSNEKVGVVIVSPKRRVTIEELKE